MRKGRTLLFEEQLPDRSQHCCCRRHACCHRQHREGLALLLRLSFGLLIVFRLSRFGGLLRFGSIRERLFSLGLLRLTGIFRLLCLGLVGPDHRLLALPLSGSRYSGIRSGRSLGGLRSLRSLIGARSLGRMRRRGRLRLLRGFRLLGRFRSLRGFRLLGRFGRLGSLRLRGRNRGGFRFLGGVRG